jgi:pimeloyl-ACP methyl ester carboxylesterase
MTACDDLVEHRYAPLDDVRLHYVQAGRGPLVILLHGFPEFWYSWRHQIPALVDAGFRVVAPDLRGYARSDKPRGTSAYRVEALAADIDQLIAHLGETRVTIVGHDLGGLVAWWTAMLYPQRVERLCIANYPHPALQTAMMLDPKQVRRSYYVALFQLPLPTRGRAFEIWARALRILFTRDPERPGAFTPEDIERYVEAFSDGTLAATLGWYRALLRHHRQAIRRKLRPIECPTQIIWGARDRAIGREWAQPPAKWVWNLKMCMIEDASHWVQIDRPESFNARLLEFLGGARKPSV